MSQCYIPSLYVVHFKGTFNSGEPQLKIANQIGDAKASARQSPDYLQLWSLVAELAQGCPKGSAGDFNQSAVRRVQLHH